MKPDPLKISALLLILSIIGIVHPLHAQESVPVVSILPADRVTGFTARINGAVNPSGSGADLVFHWGKDSEWTQDDTPPAPPIPAISDPNTPSTVRANLFDLEPGTLYRYRLIAGTQSSNFATFRTSAPPEAEFLSMTGGLSLVPPVLVPVPLEQPAEEDISGDITVLSSTTVRVAGRVDPKGGSANLSFEYGIVSDDGTVNFNRSAIPTSYDNYDVPLHEVSGDAPVDVTALLTGLSEGESYKVRIRAQGPGGMAISAEKLFKIPFLSNLNQLAPEGGLPADQTFRMDIEGTDLARWRFVGSRFWREPGEAGVAKNLTSGRRDIEFLPVPGFIHPATVFGVDIGVGPNPKSSLKRRYFATPTASGGSIQISLRPVDLNSRPEDQRPQWRVVGQEEWLDSDDIFPVKAGDHEIQFKEIGNYEKPKNLNVSVETEKVAYIVTYFPPDQPFAPDNTAELKEDKNAIFEAPFAFLGMIRSEIGIGTGFVVDERVVATANHVVFDEGNFTFITDIQWIFQRHSPSYLPAPQRPRGFYAASGYDQARQDANAMPGVGTPQSQNLDFAALWFFGESAGRGSYSGYYASDEVDNRFLTSNAEKIIAGFAGSGIPVKDFGKLHATAPFTDALTPAFGETWTTQAAQGFRGMSGGPLYVKDANSGKYYPAAIYLGGSGQTVVRAINSDVVDLFRLAKASGDSGNQNTDGGATTVGEFLADELLGKLQVKIGPQEAIDKGAGWMLSPGVSFLRSEQTERALNPGKYIVKFRTIPGFPPQPDVEVDVEGSVTPVTISYTYRSYADELETWRFENFQTRDNTGDAADSSDPDNDGETNLEEFTARTDPRKSGDFLSITTHSKTGDTFTATCTAKAGRTYTLLRSTTLSGTWERLGSKGPFSDDTPITLIDSSAPVEKSFYRIEVSLP